MVYNVLTDLDIDSLTAFQHLLEDMGFLYIDEEPWINFKACVATAPILGLRMAFTIITDTKRFYVMSAWDGDFMTIEEFLQHYYGEFIGSKHGLN